MFCSKSSTYSILKNITLVLQFPKFLTLVLQFSPNLHGFTLSSQSLLFCVFFLLQRHPRVFRRPGSSVAVCGEQRQGKRLFPSGGAFPLLFSVGDVSSLSPGELRSRHTPWATLGLSEKGSVTSNLYNRTFSNTKQQGFEIVWLLLVSMDAFWTLSKLIKLC